MRLKSDTWKKYLAGCLHQHCVRSLGTVKGSIVFRDSRALIVAIQVLLFPPSILVHSGTFRIVLELILWLN